MPINESEVVPGVWVLRFVDAADPYVPYDAVCTIAIQGGIARIYGLLGTTDRLRLRELRDWLAGKGVRELHAKRAPRHKVPGGRRVGDWFVVDLDKLADRL